MKILFLAQVLPYPLDAGPKIRAYYVLRHLAQQHEVTLVSFVRDTDTKEALDHLRGFCESVHTVRMPRSALRNGYHLLRSLLNGQPFIIARDWLPTMAECLQNALTTAHANGDGFDAVHADQLWMAPYALWIREHAPGVQSPQLVLDQHNAVYLIPERLAEGERNPLKRILLGLEARKMAKFEVDICGRFDDVVWVTQEDYDAVQAVQTEMAAGQTPNSGVIPICGAPEETPVIARSPNARRVTFLGGLHYPPNAQGICWFAEHVFPLVRKAVPDAKLTVIGKQPPVELTGYGIPDENLEITGFVDDPKPYLTETAAFVVPLHAGGGMRVKILDGWTWGLPIASTSVGAEGIQTRPDENILIADSPETFARATISLLQDRTRREQVATAGREWVTQAYNWRTRYEEWDQIYRASVHELAGL